MWGHEIIGGKVYSSTFQTGIKTDTTYIALSPDGTLEAYYAGKQNIGMYAGQNWGNMVFYYDGIQTGQLYATEEYDPVLGGTKKRFVVWSKSDGSLRLDGPGIDLDSNYVKLAGSSSAQINVKGKILDSLLPIADNSGYVGTSSYRWNTVRAKYITPGDLCFEEESCPICEQPFAPGDIITLLVHHIHEEHHTMTIPIHDRCKGVQKTLTVEVPETEEKYQFKEDGSLKAYRVSKFIEQEEEIHRVKEGYKFDKMTGQFRKKPLLPGLPGRVFQGDIQSVE